MGADDPYKPVVASLEAAIERVYEEFEAKLKPLEEALAIVKADAAPATRKRLKRRTAEENDADVLNYLREKGYADFTEAEMSRATGIAQASVQMSCGRLQELGILIETEERARGRGHVRMSKVWRVAGSVPTADEVERRLRTLKKGN